MDRKSIYIIGAALLVLWLLSFTVEKIYPPVPVPDIPTNEVPTNVLAAAGVTNAPLPATSNYTESMSKSSAPEQTLVLTNNDLVLEFTSRGGGLKSVSLKEYPAVINRTGATSMESNLATLNVKAPDAVLTLFGTNIQGDGNFSLTQQGQTVIAAKDLPGGLRVVKQFDVSSNYMFAAHVRIENTTAQPIAIPEHQVVVGTATPVGPLDDPTTLGTFWYNGVKAQNIKQPWFDNHLAGCAVLPKTPREVYEEGTNNVVWAAVHNQFFTLAAIPSNPAPRIIIHRISIPPPSGNIVSNSTTLYLTNGFQASFWYPASVLPAHQTLDNAFTFYAGPKEYNRLGKIGLQMNNNLDLIMDFTGPIGFFSKLLLISLNGLHALGMGYIGYGPIIIIITVVIKMIFWPVSRAATRSQKRMQALQPQLKAIADKYKDDPVKKNQKTMDFMKENKVSPLGSCLPTVIQIPVFFGFYVMLRNAIELRGAHFLWAHDLSQPDTIAYLPFFGGFPLNPLPLIMGVTQLWQAHLLPPSPGMEEGQQKMMKFMPLMFIAMLYRMSAGLTLYWTVSNLLSIFQTMITKTADSTGPAATTVVPLKKKK